MMTKEDFKKKWKIYRWWRRTLRDGLCFYEADQMIADQLLAEHLSKEDFERFNRMWHDRYNYA